MHDDGKITERIVRVFKATELGDNLFEKRMII